MLPYFVRLPRFPGQQRYQSNQCIAFQRCRNTTGRYRDEHGGTAGAGQGIKVKDYGDYHVTVNWTDAVNTMGMDATITKGSPFIFFDNITTGTDIVIRTGCGPMTLAFTSPSGNRRVTVCGQDYGIYFSSGTTIINNPVGGTMWQLNEDIRQVRMF